MANTTNFNWETPDDTDLVKDGAAAIRTLGNSIDTSFVDLKGGTTNQVLAKNSNTDLDFKWVADATGIPATIFDAKGDIIAASAADTAARLASSGVNGDILTVDTSTATGLKWAAPASGGAYTLLSTVTLSGASTTLSNISQSYTNLLLVGEGIFGSTSGEFVININNGTDVYQTAAYGATIAAYSAQWKISGDRSVNTGSLPLAFAGFIYNYTSTTGYKPVSSFGYNFTGSTQESCWTMGGYRNTSAVTSLVFDTSGNGTGTILVYGVK